MVRHETQGMASLRMLLSEPIIECALNKRKIVFFLKLRFKIKANFELFHGLEFVYAKLEHVHNLIVEKASNYQTVRSLFGVKSKHEQRIVVLLRQIFLFVI